MKQQRTEPHCCLHLNHALRQRRHTHHTTFGNSRSPSWALTKRSGMPCSPPATTQTRGEAARLDRCSWCPEFANSCLSPPLPAKWALASRFRQNRGLTVNHQLLRPAAAALCRPPPPQLEAVAALVMNSCGGGPAVMPSDLLFSARSPPSPRGSAATAASASCSSNVTSAAAAPSAAAAHSAVGAAATGPAHARSHCAGLRTN